MLYQYVILYDSSSDEINFGHLLQYKPSCPITKLCHMVRKIKLQDTLVYENVLGVNVGHFGIKVKVTIALAKFNHLIFQIASRWHYIPDN